MRFADPQYLSWLLLLPFFLILGLWSARQSRQRLQRALSARLLPLLSAQASPGRRRLKTLLRVVGLALVIVALARPQAGKGLSEIKVRGIEIMIAVDVSTSMLAEDIKPSRLEFVKSELNRLIDLTSGDKLGLVAFAGSAVLMSPLTSDAASLKMFVESLSPFSVETQGTNFSAALQESVDAFQRGGVEDDESQRTSRVVLVMSDGEDHETGALELAKKLATEGHRIFSVAFGTEKGGLIPIRDERGYLRSYKKDKQGREILSTVKGDFLRELAKAGSGSFHFATYGGDQAKALKADLDQLQKAEFASSEATQYDEKYMVFLFIGLLLLCAELLIGTRKLQNKVWRGRFVPGGLAVACLGLLSAANSAHADEWRGVRRNNQGHRALEQGRVSESLDALSQSLIDLPFRAEVHYNLGHAFEAAKEPLKAKSSYELALKYGARDEVKFRTLFNLARLTAEESKDQAKIDEALDLYQQALAIRPNSVETKHNIELLVNQAAQGGGGEGENDQPQDPKNQGEKPEQNPQPQNSPPPQKGPTPKPTPKPFKSQELTPQEVGKMLEEIKRQENQVREKFQREGAKEADREKDW
jgi:Ca-activated chloride channel family protein